MRDARIATLPLYPESRDCKAPTAARVIEIFEPLYADELRVAGGELASYDPTLSKLHRQALDLQRACDRLPARAEEPPVIGETSVSRPAE